MATPNADRLKIIEVWKTDPIEQANDDLRDVSARMRRVAEINRRVAADLGLEGETAQAASARLDGLASSLESRAQKVDKLAEIQGKAVESGRKAQTGSKEIHNTLQSVNEVTGRTGLVESTKSIGSKTVDSSTAAGVQAEQDAAHAEIDRRAKKVLHVLGSEMHELIGSLPDQPEHAPSSGHGSASTDAAKAGRGSGDGAGQTGVPGSASAGHQGPTRSATEWHTPGNVVAGGSGGSVGGGYDPGGGASSGVALQGSHYAPGQDGAFAPGGSRTLNPTTAPPAVFSPLATAAAIGGGTAVAGYKAYQAARAARATASTPTATALPARSGAAVRATVPSSSGILRGATTAVRATSSQTGSRGMPVRGGATGVARPVSASSSARSSGIVRGATTAVRASSPASSSRGSGILRGATTAARTPTSSPASAGKAGSYGTRTTAGGTSDRAAQSSTRATGSSASRGAGAANRTATAGRGASSSATRSGASRLSPGRSIERSSAESRSSSSSRVLSGLTGRGEANRAKDKQRKQRREKPVKPKSVSPYETDKRITFLEAGCRKESD